MKTLYLIRHAKSDWSHLWESDFNRGINDRWEKSVKIMSKFLAQKEITPDSVVSSPAIRAKITAEGIVKELKYKKKDIDYKQEIYDTHMDGYDWALSSIIEQDNSVNVLFFVGHNYAISELGAYFSGKDIWSMKTCSILALKFGVDDWSDVTYGNGEIVFFETPKTVTL